MKLNIDDKILKIYHELPEIFKIKDIVVLVGKDKLNYHTIRYQIEAMCELGMIERIGKTKRKYHREFKNVPNWIRWYVKEIKE